MADHLREHIFGLVDDMDEGMLADIAAMIERHKARTPNMRSDSVMLSIPGDDDSDTGTPHTPSLFINQAPQADTAMNLFGESQPTSARKSARGPADAASGVPQPDATEDETINSARTKKRAGIAMPSVNINDAKAFVPRHIPKTEVEESELSKGVVNCHLFSSMEEHELKVIIDAMEREEFPRNRDILTQGEVSMAKFYLIVEGTIAVLKNNKNVASMEAGQFFGELEMMYDTLEPNAATCRAVTTVVAYSLDRQTYKNVVLKVQVEKKELYRDLLNKVKFLESMSEYDKTTLAEALQSAKFEPDEKIISFGEKGQWMHFILEGECVVLGREKGKKKEIVRVGHGDVVGELEFLFNRPAGADVQAVTKVRTAKMNRKHFEMCMGPITDELKRFVAQGQYDYFLSGADKNITSSIANAEKRARSRKKETGMDNMISNLNEAGEMILAEKPKDENSKAVLHRFPIDPLDSANVILFSLREDGTICSWNGAAEKVTGYPKEQMMQASVYTFFFDPGDQKAMHDKITAALRFAGQVEEFILAMNENTLGPKLEVTFARSDGLTRARLQLEIVPPCFAAPGVETLICIGSEIKQKPQASSSDHGHWLSEQIKELVTAGTATSEALTALTEKFSAVNRQTESLDDLRPVHIRQFLGQVTSRFQSEAVAKGVTVVQQLDYNLPDEVYCDTVTFPKILEFAVENALSRCSNVKINVAANMVDEMGLEMFEVIVSDSGTGIDQTTLSAFSRNKEKGNAVASAMLRVQAAMLKLGGSMKVSSTKEKTEIVFRMPIIHVQQDTINIEGELSTSQYSPLKKLTYTTLLIEENAANRNMISAFLWERKHAVLPATTMDDVHSLANSADIIIVDPNQGIIDVPNVGAYLKDLMKTSAVVITGDNFDAAVRDSYKNAGFLTLTKPCTAIQAVAVFRAAEEKMQKIKADAEKIAATRETFSKTKRGEMKKIKVLGKGAFGEVWEVSDVLTGGKMAMKSIRVDNDANRKELLNEIEVMCTLQHQNIIHYFYAEDNTKEAYAEKLKAKIAEGQEIDLEKELSKHSQTIDVYMEYAGGGTLSGRLPEGGMPMEELRTVIRDVVEGINYIHTQRYVHCDLKTDNVLFGQDGRARLGDFGTTHRLGEGEKIYDMMGTFLYMSPECLGADREEDIGMDFKTDIWSLGAIVLECATGKKPLSHIKDVNPNSGMSITKYVCGITAPETTPDLSILYDKPVVLEFVSACMQVDPEKRPTASQLLDKALLRQEIDDTDMKTAMKALKRAQLMQALTRFVAFQDPESEKKKEDNSGSDGGFFSSDDDDDEDAPKTKKPMPKTGGFFDSSDEEEEEDEEGDSPLGSGAKTAPAPPPASVPPLPFGKSKEEPKKDQQDAEVKTDTQPKTAEPSSASETAAKTPHPPEVAPGKVRSNVKPSTPPAVADASLDQKDQAAIALHDVIMLLVASIGARCSIPVEDLRDAMRDQYEELRAQGSPDAKTTGNGRFDPNVEGLLRSDLEALNQVNARLKQ